MRCFFCENSIFGSFLLAIFLVSHPHVKKFDATRKDHSRLCAAAICKGKSLMQSRRGLDGLCVAFIRTCKNLMRFRRGRGHPRVKEHGATPKGSWLFEHEQCDAQGSLWFDANSKGPRQYLRRGYLHVNCGHPHVALWRSASFAVANPTRYAAAIRTLCCSHQ